MHYLQRYCPFQTERHKPRADEVEAIMPAITEVIYLQYTVKPAYNGTATDEFFSVAGRFHSIKAIEIWILGTPDIRKFKSFPLKTGFYYAQIPMKTGLSLYYITNV